MGKKYYVERKADNVWVVAAEDGSDAQEFNEHGRAVRHCIAMSDTEAQAEIDRLNAAAVADAVRIAELEAAQTWRPIDENTPYETRILTRYCEKRRSLIILINLRNSGDNLGKKDTFWYSAPNQQPTEWIPLPKGVTP